MKLANYQPAFTFHPIKECGAGLPAKEKNIPKFGRCHMSEPGGGDTAQWAEQC